MLRIRRPATFCVGDVGAGALDLAARAGFQFPTTGYMGNKGSMIAKGRFHFRRILLRGDYQ